MFFRFIYVNYNAWQYAGCDTLWAGIVTALAKKIEQEFSVFTTRVFRSLSLDVIERRISEKDQYLLIENNKNNLTEDLTKYIKKEFPEVEDLTEWLKKNSYKINIANKEKCWVVKFDAKKKIEEAYESYKNCKEIEVSIHKISDCSSEKQKNYRNKRGFCEHFRNFKRVGYVSSLLGIASVFLTSVSLFTYELFQDSKNNSSKSVSVGNTYR